MTAATEPLGGADAEARAVTDARARRQRPLTVRERAWSLGRASALLTTAGLLPLVADPASHPPADVVAVLILAFAVVWRSEFETGTGVVVPSTLALCPMLVLLPPAWVPAAAAAGGLLADVSTDQRTRRMLGTLACMWSVVPASLFLLVVDPGIGWNDAPWYALALVIWAGADATAMIVHQRYVIGNRQVRPSTVVAMYRVDLPLGLVAFLGAMESERFRYAFLLPFGLLLLFRQLTNERNQRIDHAAELSRAYQGTAILLGSVIDADDSYTGVHSRGVVDVVLAVADELGLPEAERRRAEFTALLHDVGKIRVPKEILRKPGR